MGEQLAQVDNRDPFAVPVWRSPVYRTPEPLIMIVQLVRLICRVLWFALTHPGVGEALDEWLPRIEHSIKPSMVQNWRNYAAYYVVPYIGSRDVREIDGAVCDALYAKLLAEGRGK